MRSIIYYSAVLMALGFGSVSQNCLSQVHKIYDQPDMNILIMENTFLKDESDLYLNFNYPLLNEEINSRYSNFNDVILKEYVISIEEEVLEKRALGGGPDRSTYLREKRFLDYKIKHKSEELLSILLFRKTSHSGEILPSYSFDCMNFDLLKGIFLEYEDFFVDGSEEELRSILNGIIKENREEGGMSLDCWQISMNDFHKNKNNFVLNGQYVEYYFKLNKECLISGDFSIEIPLVHLTSIIKKSGTDEREVGERQFLIY